jgi:TolA-binding protein
MKTAKWMAVVSIVGLVAAMSAHAAYVLTTQGQRIDGTDIRARANGEIILTTPQGTRTFYPGQYVKAVADRPPEMDQALKLVQAKQYDEAIKILEDIALKYRFLDWDHQARFAIANAYSAKGDFVAAVNAFEKLFAANPKSREESEVLWAYRKALLDAQQFDKLEQQLQSVIATGSRTEAARAQLMRGDIRMAQNQVELAAMDYLRTAILFEAEKTVQPEALWKAGDALEKLRDSRAKEMYRKLVENYPNAPQAQAARAKL